MSSNCAKQKCCICKNEFEGYGNNPHPLKTKGQCCDKCNLEKVVPVRLLVLKWREVICNKLYQTCGINNTIVDNETFANEIVTCLEKYALMNWGETCQSDCERNNKAVYFGNDRIVAKYKTSKGAIFIITEHDRSATTIMFTHEY